MPPSLADEGSLQDAKDADRSFARPDGPRGFAEPTGVEWAFVRRAHVVDARIDPARAALFRQHMEDR
jgi:hypothetical protein